jgi:hypothetical protein
MSTPFVWQGPSLLTPLTVEALLVGAPNRNSTWASLQIAYQNVSLGGDPTPLPFATLPQNSVPGTGAHVMAVLPNGLRHALNGPEGPEFRPIPNRWLILRSVSGGGGAPAQRAWVLQSDFTGSGGTNPWPGATVESNSTFIGKAYDIAAWTEPGGPTTPILRSTAPGSLSWLACYANIGNVMALYDPLTDVASGTLSYAMLGWYQPASFDPLLGVTEASPNGFTDAATWAALMSALSCEIPGGELGLSTAQSAWQTWLTAHPDIDDSSLPLAQQSHAGQNVCHGLVYGLPWMGAAQSYPRAPILGTPEKVTVAVGSTGIEAIAAWMAVVLGNPAAEDLLMALGEDLIFSYASDPSQFAQECLTRRYSKTVGETAWIVAYVRGQQAGKSGILQSIPLTEAQTAALTHLNVQQAALDTVTRTYESELWQLFGLVWKNTIDGISYPYNSLIANTVTALQGLQTQQTSLTTARNDMLATLQGLLDPSVYTLSSAPTARFMRKQAPTLLVAGAVSSTPYQTQGLSDLLPCRFTGQTLTGLEVIDPANGLPTLTEVTAAQMLAATNVPSGTALPKEYQDLVGEWMLQDTGNAAWMAALLFANAGVAKPTPTQLAGLTKTVQTLQGLPGNSSLFGPLSAQALGDAAGFVGTMPPALCALPYSPAWVPLFIDWRSGWSPSAATAAAALAPWSLDDGQYAYQWTGAAITAQTDTYSGRTVLNTDVAQQFTASVEQFVASPELDELPSYQKSLLTQAAAVLPTYDVITQAIPEFSAALVTRAGSITGLSYSSGDSGFDATVNGYLAQSQSLVPIPGILNQPPGFYPLSAGHITLQRLWVVDAFGQALILANDGQVLPIRSSSVMTAPTQGSDNLAAIQIAPNLGTGARLTLETLDATNDTILSNAADATSPIAGWLLPNHLNNSLQVFDPAGSALGEVVPVVTDTGEGLRWDPAPGLNLPLGAPPAINNPHVANFVTALLATQAASGQQALTDLLDVIDMSLWTTAPRSQPVDITTAALVGCPLAIVRASVALDAYGDLPFDQAWAATGIDDDGGLSQVPLQTYVGDLTLGQNGVLGFFLNDDYSLFRPARGYQAEAEKSGLGDLRKNLAVGRGLASLLTRTEAAPRAAPSGYVSDTPAFPLLPTGPASLLTVIMDPRGWLTALNGLLPITTTALPPGPVAQGLANLDAVFRIGPILWDAQSPDLPLPALGSAQWSWVARTDVGVWETQANLPTTVRQTIIPPRTLALREGWLTLNDFLRPDTCASKARARRR